MKFHPGKKRFIFIHSVLILICFSAYAYADQTEGKRLSRPGVYQGYSEVHFDGWERYSEYVSVRDGTRIAVDIFRPTRHGKLHTQPLPVIWEHRRYQRATQDDQGRVFSQLDRDDHPMRKVILYGYIYAVAAVRGSGASYGTRIDPTPPVERSDAYDMTEWLAKQSWSNGQIGMYGISYSGTAQFMAASANPPHLKAIFPEMAMFDLYDLCYPGGIYRHTLMKHWGDQIHGYDMHLTGKPAYVDNAAENDFVEVLKEHTTNFDVTIAEKATCRDSRIDGAGTVYLDNSPSNFIAQVNQSGVAVYQRAGWYDMYPRDMLLWYRNLNVPKKIVIGPWNHYQSNGLDRATEMLRWYDYWLKGIDNGIMDEPPILYGVIGLPKNKSIRWANTWPPENIRPVEYFLSGEPSGSVKSVNDGSLKTSLSRTGNDIYTVDYTASSGSKTRWTGGQPDYTDMNGNDCKGLTYTSDILTTDIEVVGHPLVSLWVGCSVDDVDLFAYLEEIDGEGRGVYITEGCLRASHRKLTTANYDRMGLPYHRSNACDIEKLSDQPCELIFDMYPTANLFNAGHRIRLTITCADRDNNLTPELNPAPKVTIYRSDDKPSKILLPISR